MMKFDALSPRQPAPSWMRTRVNGLLPHFSYFTFMAIVLSLVCSTICSSCQAKLDRLIEKEGEIGSPLLEGPWQYRSGNGEKGDKNPQPHKNDSSPLHKWAPLLKWFPLSTAALDEDLARVYERGKDRPEVVVTV